MRETVVKTEEFKDSPLGRIPKDWDVKPLSELADVDRGKFTHRPRNDPRFYGGSYPFIQTGDIANSSGGILSTYSQTLNERGITVSREFPVGTIAITIAANIADTAILGIPMFFPDSVVGAVVKKPNSIRYVELCIRRAKQRLDARAPQSAQKNINLEDLRPLLIPVPSPEEQHRIAEVIDTIDSTIAHTSSLIAKLKQMKAGLLHDLLTRGLDENGELRDAIGHPEQFTDSPLGQIPKNWKCLTINDCLRDGIIIDVQDGNHGEAHPKTDDFVTEGIPFVMAKDLVNGEINLAECHKITWHQYQSLRIGFARPGDVLLSHKGTIGLISMVPSSLQHIMLTPQVTYYRVSEEKHLLGRFLFYFFHSPLFQQRLEVLSAQSTRSYIGITLQKTLSILIPPPDEQSRIVEKFDTHNTRLRTEEAYRDKLKLQKQGLMHDLLTGKVRVKDADKLTPASDTV